MNETPKYIAWPVNPAQYPLTGILTGEVYMPHTSKGDYYSDRVNPHLKPTPRKVKRDDWYERAARTHPMPEDRHTPDYGPRAFNPWYLLGNILAIVALATLALIAYGIFELFFMPYWLFQFIYS